MTDPLRALLRDLVRVDWTEHGRALRYLLRWVALGSAVGVLAGTASAAVPDPHLEGAVLRDLSQDRRRSRGRGGRSG